VLVITLPSRKPSSVERPTSVTGPSPRWTSASRTATTANSRAEFVLGLEAQREPQPGADVTGGRGLVPWIREVSATSEIDAMP